MIETIWNILEVPFYMGVGICCEKIFKNRDVVPTFVVDFVKGNWKFRKGRFELSRRTAVRNLKEWQLSCHKKYTVYRDIYGENHEKTKEMKFEFDMIENRWLKMWEDVDDDAYDEYYEQIKRGEEC